MTCTPHRNIPVVKSRRIRWAGHVARMGEEDRCIRGDGGGNLMERDHLSDYAYMGP
jgi:hypothetical protein